MAYIGQEPKIEFSSVPTKDSFTGDGSTVAFDLSAAVATGAENALEVFVDNVRQEPGSGKAYTLGLDGSNDNKRITFTAAPANGAAIYVINDKSNTTTLVTPTNLGGVELILDADSDTSITADTDDQIDIKIAAADHLQIKSSSGDTVLKPMVDAKDIIFQQFDGNKIFCIDDGNFVSVGGNSAAPGEIRIYEDTDLGANYTGFKAGNLTASVAYQLPLADGSSGQALATDGSGVLSWTTVSANTPSSADGQALGSASLEWSDLFLADGAVINLGADQDVTLTHVADTGVLLNGASVIQFRDSGLTIGSNADGDLDIVSDGTAVDSINIESAGGITLDAGTAGSGVIYEDDGTEMMRIHNSSSDVIIETKVSDKDFIIKGNDGGSVITPFTLDMSAGGDLFLTGGLIDLKNDGSAVSQIKFYCESSNAHAQTLIGAPHSESATNTLTLPSSGGDAKLVSVSSTATLTNKTLTTPVIAEIDSGSTITLDATTDIVLDADGGDIFFKDDGTTFGSATNTSGNLIIKSGTTTAATFSGANVTLAGTVGSGAITSTGIVTGTGFTAGNAVLAEAELELLDGLTAGTAIASKVVTTDANIDTTGQRNLTITGELDAATLDISGDADIDGTTNLDVVDIDGAVDMASTLQVDGAITTSDGMIITTADNTDTLTLISTDDDTAEGPILNFTRNPSSIAAGDLTGTIKFVADDAGGNVTTYYEIQSSIEDGTDGGEDGRLTFMQTLGGSAVNMLDMLSGNVVFNQDSNDVDFRVESNGNTHMIFVDAGNDHVNIGTSTDHGGVLNVEHGDNTDTLMLVSTDADGGTGPNLTLYRKSASPADNDDTGIINFRGRNDNSQDVEYAQIKSILVDASDGTEDGKLELYHMLNGSLAPSLQLTSSEVVINESSNDLNFRVESNGNTHMIFVDAGNDHVNIGTSSDLGATLNVNGSGYFTTADNTDTLTLRSTDDDANSGPVLNLLRDSASPADSDLIGRIDFSAESDLGSETNYAVIKVLSDDVSHGVEDGQFSIFTRVNGSETDRMTMGSATTVFNDGSADLDLRVETNSKTHALFVDGGNDVVMVGGAGSGSGTTDARMTLFPDGMQYHFVASNSSTDVNRYYNANSGSLVGKITMAASSTAFTTSSDYRLKENVDYDWDATTRLKQLKPARFNWIVDDTNTLQDGFIAHEVSGVVPEAVIGDKDAIIAETKYEAGDDIPEGKEIGDVKEAEKIDPQGIDQSKLVPLMVKTIQELEARIKVLEDA